MGRIPDGGVPATTLITISDSPSAPTLLAAIRDGGADKMRSVVVIQNVGVNTVYIGGVGVGVGGGAHQGLVLGGIPDPQTSPITQPKSISLSTTNQAIYGITDASAGGGSVVVYEEVA